MKSEEEETDLKAHYARMYIDMGLSIFPINKDCKTPRILGWQSRSSNDPAQIEQWLAEYPGCNWAMDCEKSEVTVLDVDTKHGQDGLGTYEDAEIDHGIDDSFEVATASNDHKTAYHVYLFGAAKSTTSKLGPGLDTKSIGGYVLIPGSHYIDEKNPELSGTYTVRNDRPIAHIPESLVDALGQANQKDPERNVALVELDLPFNITRATDYLKKEADPSIQGEGGDNNAFIVGCMVRDFGIEQSTALELMLDHWNQRCEPSWSVEELSIKVRNAYNHASSRIGSKAPQGEFEPYVPTEDEMLINELESSNVTQVRSLDQMLDSPDIERPWLIENWLPKSKVTLLYGDGGMGKSLMSLQMALGLSMGTTFLNIPVREQIQTLCIMAEDDELELNIRVKEIMRSKEYGFLERPDPPNFFTWSMEGHSSLLVDKDGRKAKFYKRLDAQLASMRPGHKLLVLDTLSDIFAGNENDRSESSQFVKVVLARLKMDHDLTILVLAHPSQSSIEAGRMTSGSTGWSNAVRHRLAVRPHEDDALTNYKVMECLKSNYGASGTSVTSFWERGAYVAIESEEDILADVLNLDKECVFKTIKDYENVGTLLGHHANSHRFIGAVEMQNHNGESLSKSRILRCAEILEHEGRINLVKNRSRGNGYSVVQNRDSDDARLENTGATEGS